MELYRCPHCGKEIEIDDKSCSGCGVEFFELEEIPEIIREEEEDGEEEIIECPACGWEVSSSKQECPRCSTGFIIDEKTEIIE